MDSFTAIIKAWPDNDALAADCRVPASLVAVWKSRDTIPAAYWSSVIEGAQRREIAGVSFELLGRLTQSKRARAAE